MVLYVPPASAPAAPGTIVWTLVDPSGGEHDLTQATNPSAFVARGAKGLGTPAVDLTTEKLPTAPGGLVRYVSTRPLEIDLPIVVAGASFADLVGKVEELRGWFATGDETTRQPLTLRVTRPQDGEAREIACYYVRGLEGDLSEGGLTWVPLVVSLLAPDPYWTDTTDTELVFAQADLGAQQAVLNGGDFAAYPIWTVSGPAEGVTVTNVSTGEAFAFIDNGGLVVAAGSTLTVDTRPSSQRTLPQVIYAGDSAVFDRLTPASSLWWLAPGQTTFLLSATNTSASTTVNLRYRQRYRGVIR